MEGKVLKERNVLKSHFPKLLALLNASGEERGQYIVQSSTERGDERKLTSKAGPMFSSTLIFFSLPEKN